MKTQRLHVSKIDTSGRISVSKKILELLECNSGDYIALYSNDTEPKKICIEKFKG